MNLACLPQIRLFYWLPLQLLFTSNFINLWAERNRQIMENRHHKQFHIVCWSWKWPFYWKYTLFSVDFSHEFQIVCHNYWATFATSKSSLMNSSFFLQCVELLRKCNNFDRDLLEKVNQNKKFGVHHQNKNAWIFGKKLSCILNLSSQLNSEL